MDLEELDEKFQAERALANGEEVTVHINSGSTKWFLNIPDDTTMGESLFKDIFVTDCDGWDYSPTGVVIFDCAEPFQNQYMRVPFKWGFSWDDFRDAYSSFPIDLEEPPETLTVTKCSSSIRDIFENTSDHVEEELPINVFGQPAVLTEIQKTETTEDNPFSFERLTKWLNTYNEIKSQKENGNDYFQIPDGGVSRVDERKIELDIQTTTEKNLTFWLDVPEALESSGHPVTEFVETVGCGSLKNLEGEVVELVHADNVNENDYLKTDVMFTQFGIRPVKEQYSRLKLFNPRVYFSKLF